MGGLTKSQIIQNGDLEISSELKQKWAKSLHPVPSHAVENKEVYPKILQELDELYNSRLERRILEIQAQYEEKAKREEKLRNEKIDAARARAAEKAQKEAQVREKEAQRQKLEMEKIRKEKQEQEEKLRKEAEKVSQPQPVETPVQPAVVTPVPATVEENAQKPTENAIDPRHNVLPSHEDIAAVIRQIEKTCDALIKAWVDF